MKTKLALVTHDSNMSAIARLIVVCVAIKIWNTIGIAGLILIGIAIMISFTSKESILLKTVATIKNKFSREFFLSVDGKMQLQGMMNKIHGVQLCGLNQFQTKVISSNNSILNCQARFRIIDGKLAETERTPPWIPSPQKQTDKETRRHSMNCRIWFVVVLFWIGLQAKSFARSGRNSVANSQFEIRNLVSEGASSSFLRYYLPPETKERSCITASQLVVVLTTECEESNPKEIEKTRHSLRGHHFNKSE